MEVENQKSEIAKQEEEILKFWQDNKIFEQTLAKPAPHGDFVFYDGPPFATGRPHFGHLLPTAIKDVIPRYQTMRGRRVTRQWGWDCHGLPIENLIEKELGLKTKKEIEKYGLALFNQKARESVLRYAEEWEKIIPRLGRWVDMANSYRTMDPPYTESVWRVFKTFFDKGLVYEGYKSMHLCPRCETTLANFEVNLGYKDITDLAVTVKFELIDELGTFLLAWTTTPWTLPGNVALAVNEKITYCKIKLENNFYILAKNRIVEVLKDKEFEIVEEFAGEKLVGKKYQPPFDYYQGSTLKDAQGRTLERETGWKVYSADFVTTEEGTGIVHIAPAFGEDDMKLGEEKKLPFIQHVTRDGRFKPEVTDFAGLPVKPKDDHQSTDILIIKYLAHKNVLFAKEKIIHSYPHCWRCDTPLLNYAANSWFIKVTDLKEKLLAENQKINWVPEHIKNGRFGKWLEGARDWAVSRQRFWGAPLPIWRCEKCDKVKIIGSLEELKQNIKTSGNKYFVMRHGEGEHQIANVYSNSLTDQYHLTEKGREEVCLAVEKLKTSGITKIVSSPVLRCQETAEIVSKILHLAAVTDPRLRELDFGKFAHHQMQEFNNWLEHTPNYFTDVPESGESLLVAKKRFGELLYECEKKYQNEKILFITHTIGFEALTQVADGADSKQSEQISRDLSAITAEVREISFVPLPHNADYELDFHRPGIDEVKLSCGCGLEMKRIEDVFDVWFESGAMPYRQEHFPADFIAEGVDQTRGWFYSLLVLGVGLFGKSPYKNVVVNGLILAEDGQKMSKRLNNYPDLNLTIDKYGADALRFYLLSSPAARGEEFSFSERGLGEVMRRVIMRLKNVLAFYQLYAMENSSSPPATGTLNVLDAWISACLSELNQSVSQALDAYKLDQVGKPIDEFVDDLSTWYLRRSRERLKSEDQTVQTNALNVLRQVLLTLAKIIAPIIPFIAEEIYQAVRSKNDLMSVHLESWPAAENAKRKTQNAKLLEEMAEVRRLVSLALEERSKLGIKVRQPLQTLFIRGVMSAGITSEFISLIKDEVNVKEVTWQVDLVEPVKLDAVITPELRAEGRVRDFIRQVQDLRKDSGLQPRDQAILFIAENHADRPVIEAHQSEICRAINATAIRWSKKEKVRPLRLERA